MPFESSSSKEHKYVERVSDTGSSESSIAKINSPRDGGQFECTRETLVALRIVVLEGHLQRVMRPTFVREETMRERKV